MVQLCQLCHARPAGAVAMGAEFPRNVYRAMLCDVLWPSCKAIYCLHVGAGVVWHVHPDHSSSDLRQEHSSRAGHVRLVACQSRYVADGALMARDEVANLHCVAV